MMKIAWLGGVNNQGSGVGGIGAMLLEGVLQQGIHVDFYASFEQNDIPERIRAYPNFALITTPTDWEWGKWYSRSSFPAFLSSTIARKRAYDRLCDLLIMRHEILPYDCIVQLSQTELFKLGENRHRLPPIVIYPCVHAAGELEWHRKESAYALKSENAVLHYITRLMLTYRTGVQKRELQKPNLVIGMSQRFNDLVARDYDLPIDRQAVLYHSIRQQSEADAIAADVAAQARSLTKLVFVARISVRKGLQYIVELSHRLNDLAGEVELEIIGDKTQWSDYRAHLNDLNPNIAQYRGSLNHHELADVYDNADILLLPSLYEPGGIVVGEALSHGLCLVVSDAIGSAEVVEGRCRREFPAGDMNRFEQEVRQLITDLKTQKQSLREEARSQCATHFTTEKVSSHFIGLLQQTIAQAKPEERAAFNVTSIV